jgi:hypothetical protein
MLVMTFYYYIYELLVGVLRVLNVNQEVKLNIVHSTNKVFKFMWNLNVNNVNNLIRVWK